MVVEFKDIPTYKIKDLFMATNAKKGKNVKRLRIFIRHRNSKKSIIILIHFKLWKSYKLQYIDEIKNIQMTIL